jgi:hypothetical protein
LIDALDLNWGARMSEVQVTCDLSRTELSESRSDRSCADPAIDSAMENLSISRFRAAISLVGSGSATSCRAPGFQLSLFEQVQRAEMGIVSSSRQHTDVAGSDPLTDIFIESSKAPLGARSSSRLIVQRCSISLESRSSEVTPRSLNTSERGLRLCR